MSETLQGVFHGALVRDKSGLLFRRPQAYDPDGNPLSLALFLQLVIPQPYSLMRIRRSCRQMGR